jgi:type II secretion system protein H
MVLRHRDPRAAFTLVELLLVLVILGVVAAIVVPMAAGSLAGNQRRMAVRSVVGATKYARSMAVLQQCPMELRISGPDGRNLVVDATANWQADTNSVKEVEEASMADGLLLSEVLPDAPVPVPDVDVRLERELKKIKIVVWGIGDGAAEPFEEDARIAFEINGRCTPFFVVLEDQGGKRVRVSIDHLGGAMTEVEP